MGDTLHWGHTTRAIDSASQVCSASPKPPVKLPSSAGGSAITGVVGTLQREAEPHGLQLVTVTDLT